MAIVSGLTGFQTIGVTYTARVDNLYESSGITNNTYFRSLDDGFAYYKDNSGNVIGVFDTGDGDITRVQPGTNITTGGTANEPVVNLADDIVLNSISATTISGGTIYSGGTDLYDIFGSGGNFANADLTVDANRTHDMAGYDMKFDLFSSTGQFILSSGQGGYGNFNFIPYSTSSGGVARIDNGLSYIQFRANYGAEVNKLSINKNLNASAPTLGVKGTGSTSGTTTALFENSSGTDALKILDDTQSIFQDTATVGKVTIVSIDRAVFAHKNHVDTTNFALLQTENGITVLNAVSGQQVNFNVGNVTHASLFSTGDLSIGNSSASARLHVKGAGSTSATKTAFFENSSGTPSLRIDDAGNVYHQGGANISTNTVFGFNANPSGTGQYNTAYGFQAMEDATTAANSVAIGYRTLAQKTFGNSNIAIGRQAGENIAGGAEANVLIGKDAGRASAGITFFDNHVGIGTGAAYNLGSSNGISIGRDANGNGNASIAIGRSSETSANYAISLNSSQSTRTNSTANSLEVYVDNVGTDPVFKVGQTSDSYYGGSGNFGIGTLNPTEKLDVSGNTKISGSLNIGTILSGTPLINLGLDSSGNVVTGTTGGLGDITRVQPGTNITTGGTANEPVVNLADDIVLNSISATTISGGTMYIGTGATIANETPAITYNQQIISAQGANGGEITYAPFRWGQVATNQYALYGTDETGAIQSNDLGDSSTNTRWKDIYWRGSLDHRYARIDINNGTDAGILFYANQGSGSNGQMKLVSTSSQEGLLIRDDGVAGYGLNTSAIMQLVSTSRGFLPPKMTTTQRDSITTPTSGLIVYDTSLGEPHYYNGSSWISLEPSSGVTGSGTNNTIPIWNGSQTLTDSILTYDGSGEITVLGSVNITGNVEVLGTATTINTQNLNVVDNDILLNSGGTHTSAIGGGIFIEDGISNGNDSTWTINSSGEWSANTSILTQGINVQSGAMQSGGTDLYSIFTTPGNSGIYGGSGTVPSSTNVTLTDNINFGSNTLYVDGASGEVGIGTSSPDSKLHVYGNNSDVQTKIEAQATNGTTRSASLDIGSNLFNVNNNYTYAYRWQVSGGTGADDYELHLKGLERVSDAESVNDLITVNASGQVGIGTNTPSFKLDVVSPSELTSRFINDTNGDISGLRVQGYTTAGSIRLFDTYIDPDSGEYGFTSFLSAGSDSPVFGGNQVMLSFSSLEATFNQYAKNFDVRIEGQTDANLFFADASTDRIGIGTSSPAYHLEVTGTTNIGGPIYSAGTELSTLFASAGGGGIYDGSGTVPSSTNVTLTDDITFGSGTVKLSNSTATSLTSGALWANGTSGAIIFDSSAEKRLYWNDGGGNFGLRAGNYYNSGEKYVKTGDGAVEIGIGTDSQNGNIILQTSTAGTAGATVSWANRMDITTSQTVINELGNDIDFRVEGLSDTNLIVTDAANDRVGIGGTPGAYKFDVSGSLNSDGIIYSAGTPLETIISNISSVSDTNFANTNLTVSGTRIHDTGGNVLIWSSDGGTLNDFAIGFGAVSITFGHNNIFLEGSNNDMSFQDGLGNRIISFTSGNTVVNGNSQDIDFRVEGQTDANLFFTDAANDRVGIGTATPEEKFEVSGNTKLNGQYYFMSDGTVSSSPGGYGDIVTFGTGALSAGTLYYLNSSQAWVAADADAASSSTGMLGIALGTSPSDGILIRGFARSTSYTQTNGSILYVSTTAGGITSTAPSAAGDIVRIIGYMVNDASDVIYFNPSNDWIEL